MPLQKRPLLLIICSTFTCNYPNDICSFSVSSACISVAPLLRSLNFEGFFLGTFRTNFINHFSKLFLFTKFNFHKFQKKVFLNVLRSICLEFFASNYSKMAQFKTSKHQYLCFVVAT